MIIDIVVIIVLLASALIAFLRGLIREVLTIVSSVGALAAAYFISPLLKPFVRNWLGVEEGVEPEKLFGLVPYTILGDALSYGGVFIVVIIVLSIISHMVAEAVKSMGLGAIDRTFGVIFGLARGVLFIGLLYLPLHLFLDSATKETVFKGSKTHIYLEQTAGFLAQALPESAIEKMETGTQKMQETVDETMNAREQLEKIELLKKSVQDRLPAFSAEKDKLKGAVSGQESKQEDEDEGYNQKFRQNMNKLIEQGLEQGIKDERNE